MCGRLTLILILFSGFLNLNSFCQDKPKVGLVLSGGGAKGIAHIGVLKTMEEAGIVPDMIVGTSMGAIVGALYSLGYSADEIEEKILAIDWDMILTNQVPLSSIAFEEKEYYNRYSIEFPISDGRVKLPNGLIESQMLTEILQYHLWPSLEYDNFDNFPIPFRCIGTDLQTGEAIVFKSGSLYKAVRSSMAMPGAFTAVNLDTTFAVDGGLVENFPVNRVLKMGADYVIGVNVSSTTLSGNENFETIGEIAMSVAMIGSNKRSKSEIDSCDIYIEPNVGAYAAGNFTKAKDILQIGIQAAEAHKEEFKALAKKLNQSQNEVPKPKIDSIQINTVSIDKSELYSDRLLHSKLDIQPPASLSREEIGHSIRNVFGVNAFHKVEYKLNPQNQKQLMIGLEEKTPGRLFASLHIDNVFATGLLLNLTYRDLLGKDSRSVFVLDISKNPKFRFDYYKYTGQEKKLALNFRYNFLNEEVPSYNRGQVNDIIVNQIHTLRGGLLTTQSLKQSFALYGYFSSITAGDKFQNVVPAEIDRLRLNSAGIQFGYFRNTLNNRNFPTKGTELDIIFKAIAWSKYNLITKNDADSVRIAPDIDFYVPTKFFQTILDGVTPNLYFQLNTQIRKYFPLSNSLSLIGDLGVGLTISDLESGTLTDEFILSGRRRVNLGEFRTYGFTYDEISKPNVAVAGLSVQKVIFRNLFLRGGANLIGAYDYISYKSVSDEFSFDTFKDENINFGYGLEASFRSRIGPVSGGISKNTEDSYLRYYFSFGYSFNYSDP